MLNLSTGMLISMGFQPFDENNEIEAKFHSLNVYEVRGINNANEFLNDPNPLKEVTPEVSISIGASLNDLCKSLTGDKWVENEEEWRKEKKTTPPYLMVLTSLPETTTCRSGFLKKDQDRLLTYNCFPEEKKKITLLEKERTYPVVTALSAVLSNNEHIVTFHPIEREVYGITKDGKQITDFLMTGHGEITTQKNFESFEISSGFQEAFKIGSRLHYKVGYFFDLAMREKDDLKKFLFYFLVLEVHTQQTFKKLNQSTSYKSIIKLPEHVAVEGSQLLEVYQKEEKEFVQDAKNLVHRLIWCSILFWTDVNDKDVQQFRELKKIRDKIFHGEEIDLTTLPINQARHLALKMIYH